MDLACLEMEENVCLKLWVKIGCSPQCTPIVQKSHLDGHMARMDFSHTRARRDVQKTASVFAGSEFGWIWLA